jgi:hypothetical protein
MTDDKAARAALAQQKHTDHFMRKRHVMGIGVGIGLKGGEPTGNICLVVLVDEKVPLDALDPVDWLPDEVDNVEVDVQEIGRIVAQ